MANEAHVRIDEGVKRGPRKRSKAPLRRDPETGLAQSIPPDLDPKTVLDLYLQYPTTSGIAAKLGLRRSSLTLWLREKCPEDWKNVQLAKAHMRKEDGDEGIEVASDPMQLARAREMLRSGQWDLERLDSANYGQKQEVTVVNEVRIETVLDGEACQLLGKMLAQSVALTPNAALLEGESRLIESDDIPPV